MPTKRRMHLVAYLKTGPTANHVGAWRHPAANLDDLFEPERYEHLARVLEAGYFDCGFFADTFGIPDLHGNHFRTFLEKGARSATWIRSWCCRSWRASPSISVSARHSPPRSRRPIISLARWPRS